VTTALLALIVTGIEVAESTTEPGTRMLEGAVTATTEDVAEMTTAPATMFAVGAET
jgi:hypothetical protein